MPKSPLVTINVTQVADIEVRAAEERKRYAAKFLKPGIICSNTKVYIYPEVHAVLSRMADRFRKSGMSIGSYVSEIILDHFANNREVMEGLYDENSQSLF